MAGNLSVVIGADTTGFNKAVELARNTLNRYKNEAGTAAEEIRRSASVSRELAAAYERVVKALGKVGSGTLNTTLLSKLLLNQIRELTILWANLDNTAKSSDFGKSISASVTAAKSQLQQLDALLKSTQSIIQLTNSKGNNFSLFGKSFNAKGIEGQIQGVTSSMAALGLQGGSTLSMLASGGKALLNPYTAVAAAVAGCTYEFVDFNTKLEEQTSKTAKFLNMSLAEAEPVRNAIKSIADTYNTDFDTALSMTDTMTKQWGIDAKTATDLISVGMAGGANEAGNMANMISTFAGKFKDAGISAEQFVALMTLTESGLFSELGMTVISKALQKLTEMSSATSAALNAAGINATEMGKKLNSGAMSGFDAILEVSKAIKKLDPSTQAYAEVVKNVFGKQGVAAGSALIDTFAEMDTSLLGVIDRMTPAQRAIYNLQSADNELEDALVSVFGTSVAGFDTMTKNLKIKVFNGLTKVINGFIDLYNKSGLIRGEIQLLGLSFKFLWLTAKLAIKLIGHSFLNLGDILSDITTLNFEKLLKDGKKLAGALANDAANWGKAMGDAFTTAWLQTTEGHIYKVHLDHTVDENSNKPAHTGTGGSGSSSGKNGKSNSSNDKLQESIDKFKRQLVADAHNDKGMNTKKEDEQRAAAEAFWKEKAKAENDNARETSIKQELFQTNSKAFDNIQNKVDLGQLDPETAERLVEQLNEQLANNEIDIKFNLDTSGVGAKTKKIADGMQTASDYTNMLAGALQNVNQAAQSDGINIAVVIALAIAEVIGAYALNLAKDKTTSGNIWAFIAAAAASTISMVSTIAAMKSAGSFANGGIITGATNVGDLLSLAHVNNGEMILNGSLLSRLFRLLNGSQPYNATTAAGGNVSFTLYGEDLYGSINNYNRVHGTKLK